MDIVEGRHRDDLPRGLRLMRLRGRMEIEEFSQSLKADKGGVFNEILANSNVAKQY